MPVYRDEVGGIGTPTSDHERTKLSLTTTRLLTIINGYDGDEKNLCRTVEYMKKLLIRYADAKEIEVCYFQ